MRKSKLKVVRIRYALALIGMLIAVMTLTNAQAQETATQVGIFEPAQVAPGEVVQVPIFIKNVQDLYGFDVIIEFDPGIVQVEDADLSNPNVQVSLGDFLDPGLLLFNAADNEIGMIRFTMSQYNPSDPKTGEGILFVVRFKGAAEGESELKVSFIQLATRDGIEIPAVGIDSKISVISGVPVQEATLPIIETTAIILVATETPTPTATANPTQTATAPVSTPTPIIHSTNLVRTTEDVGSFDDTITKKTSWISRNWWLFGVFVLLIMIPGVYLWVKRNLQKEKYDGQE